MNIKITYPDCKNKNIKKKVELMLARGAGNRDISKIELISIGEVLSILRKSKVVMQSKQS